MFADVAGLQSAMCASASGNLAIHVYMMLSSASQLLNQPHLEVYIPDVSGCSCSLHRFASDMNVSRCMTLMQILLCVCLRNVLRGVSY